MAMLHEEELSELAGDISVYVLLAAMLLVFVAGQACAGGWGCAVAHVVTKIWAQAILVLLLLPLALVLFFRRAAGCSSKVRIVTHSSPCLSVRFDASLMMMMMRILKCDRRRTRRV